MCGIFGVISSEPSIREAPGYLKDCFIAGAVRGQDSSGIMQLEPNGKLRTHRAVMSGAAFAREHTVSKFLDDADRAWATFGHNRSATTGGLGLQAAHPFSFYNKGDLEFAGMHNGTLEAWDKTNTMYHSDTHWALSQIKEQGAGAVRAFQGAFVFVWYNPVENDRVINIVRNKERPLHFAYTPNMRSVIFASEAEMLFWLADRNGIKLRNNAVYGIEENCHYKFSVDEPWEVNKTRITPLSKKELKAISERVKTEAANAAAKAREEREAMANSIKSHVAHRFIVALTKEASAPPVRDDSVTVTEEDRQRSNDELSYAFPTDKAMAKSMGVFMEEVTFFPVTYERDKLAVGNCFFGPSEEEVWSEIKYVNKEMWEFMEKAASCTCKIIGVSKINHLEGNEASNLSFTLTKPIYFNMKDGSRIERRTGIIYPPEAGDDDDTGTMCVVGCKQ